MIADFVQGRSLYYICQKFFKLDLIKAYVVFDCAISCNWVDSKNICSEICIIIIALLFIWQWLAPKSSLWKVVFIVLSSGFHDRAQKALDSIDLLYRYIICDSCPVPPVPKLSAYFRACANSPVSFFIACLLLMGWLVGGNVVHFEN